MTSTHAAETRKAGVCTNPPYYPGPLESNVHFVSTTLTARPPTPLDGGCKLPSQRLSLERILRIIHDRPGPSLQELVDNAPAGERKIRWMLSHLHGAGIVTERRVSGARRFFPSTFANPLAQTQAVVLRDPDTARLYARLQTRTWSQQDLLALVESWNWSRGKLRRCLKRLEEAGLLRRGGTTRYPSLRAKAPQEDLAKMMR